MNWLLSVLKYLLIGPSTPSMLEYWNAVKSEPLSRREDKTDFHFHEDEIWMHNHRVSILFWQDEFGATVNAQMYGKLGGLIFSVRDGEILDIIKDGIQLQPSLLAVERKAFLFNILNQVEQEVKALQ